MRNPHCAKVSNGWLPPAGPARTFTSMIRRPALAALLASLTALVGVAHAYDTPLPDIGSSAGTVASPEEQRQYGFYMLHELRNQQLVLDDELVADYLNTLGYR